MQRRTALITATVAVALLATGCGSEPKQSGGPAALPSTSTSTTATSSASASPSRTNEVGTELNGRGNIPKEFGEEAGVGNPADRSAPWILTFSVDSVTADIACDSGFSSPPQNGHFLGIQLRASTTPEFADAGYFVTFSAGDFRVIGPDGLTVSDVQGQASSCLGPNGFTYQPLGPGQQYAGTVVIDSPVTSGSLIYAPMGQPTGWEWQFGG